MSKRMTSEEYDRLARQFRKETGMMAPGKDKPVALAGVGASRKERRDAWRDWLRDRNQEDESE